MDEVLRERGQLPSIDSGIGVAGRSRKSQSRGVTLVETIPWLGTASRRKRWLVGVSGGADSVALLHLLVAAGFSNLVVCHLDHGLRGRASTEDAKFVKRLAAKLGVDAEETRRAYPRIAEVPFDSEYKFMATFHRDGDQILMFVKGAPDVVEEVLVTPRGPVLTHYFSITNTTKGTINLEIGRASCRERVSSPV